MHFGNSDSRLNSGVPNLSRIFIYIIVSINVIGACIVRKGVHTGQAVFTFDVCCVLWSSPVPRGNPAPWWYNSLRALTVLTKGVGRTGEDASWLLAVARFVYLYDGHHCLPLAEKFIFLPLSSRFASSSCKIFWTLVRVGVWPHLCSGSFHAWLNPGGDGVWISQCSKNRVLVHPLKQRLQRLWIFSTGAANKFCIQMQEVFSLKTERYLSGWHWLPLDFKNCLPAPHTSALPFSEPIVVSLPLLRLPQRWSSDWKSLNTAR